MRCSTRVLGFLLLLTPVALLAHCDTMNGPVVAAAKKALESGNLNHVLPWVQKPDVPEVEKAFRRTVEVRKLGPEARQLADTWFFETVVRVHRAGEGAPYTGLKPGDEGLTSAIVAADHALETGSVDAVVKLVTEQAGSGIRERFERANSLKKFPLDQPDQGREFVKAYVEYVHYVERLNEAAGPAAAAHSHEQPAPSSAAHAHEH